jgi:hypothetical protein
LRLLRQLVLDIKSRPKAHLAIALVVASNQISFVALAAAPTLSPIFDRSVQAAALCKAGLELECPVMAANDEARVAVPAGAQQCPASGEGAACTSMGGVADATPGVGSTPDGQSPCAPTGVNPGLSSPAACTDILLPASALSGNTSTRIGSVASPVVTPSVPVSTLRPGLTVQRLDLAASDAFVEPGHKAVLTATASTTMTGTNSAIEIFDLTTQRLVGACSESSQCIVAYAASSGVHTFAAFITKSDAQLPIDSASAASNQVSVTWYGITLAANQSVVAPGNAVTITATSTFDVAKAGRTIVIYDSTTKHQITYCSRGTTCSTSLTQAAGGVHEIVGLLPGQPQAASQAITTTWLAASLSGSTTRPQVGAQVHLVASANTDLTNTPWSLGIYDQAGQLVAPACKSGSSCRANVTLTSSNTPYFSAVIGAEPPVNAASTIGQLLRTVAGPAPLVDIQTRSSAIQPTRILWGVDSCKAFTSSPTAADGIYPQVAGRFGAPDFWGRYLTNTGCPGISPTEVAAAAHLHMGILPIYNDYNCSNVVSYATGQQYAAEATAAAANIGIPRGRALAIDIEPPGDQCPGAAGVDAGFVQGWYDGVAGAAYVPAYYGNGTAGTEFASAWCAAVSAQPAVATYSYLWSFQPSLLGAYSKATAPGYRPYEPGCAGHMAAWQYQIDSSMSGHSDVDHDEALSTLPLWYPSGTSH